MLERITPRSDKGLVSYPFKAEERVRVPHGVQLSGSSVGRERRSDTAEVGGSIPPRTTVCGESGLFPDQPGFGPGGRFVREPAGSGAGEMMPREAWQNGIAARC